MKFKHNDAPKAQGNVETSAIQMSKNRAEDLPYYHATAAAAKKNGMPYYGKARSDAVSTRTKSKIKEVLNSTGSKSNKSNYTR